MQYRRGLDTSKSHELRHIIWKIEEHQIVIAFFFSRYRHKSTTSFYIAFNRWNVSLKKTSHISPKVQSKTLKKNERNFNGSFFFTHSIT